MPYIKEEDRYRLQSHPEDIQNAGELNYMVTRLLDTYINKHGLSYSACNDVLGVLTAANHEFARRVLSDYEDTKIKDNGDVYTTRH